MEDLGTRSRWFFFRRLANRYERREDIHDTLLELGCALIRLHRLEPVMHFWASVQVRSASIAALTAVGARMLPDLASISTTLAPNRDTSVTIGGAVDRKSA